MYHIMCRSNCRRPVGYCQYSAGLRHTWRSTFDISEFIVSKLLLGATCARPWSWWHRQWFNLILYSCRQTACVEMCEACDQNVSERSANVGCVRRLQVLLYRRCSMSPTLRLNATTSHNNIPLNLIHIHLRVPTSTFYFKCPGTIIWVKWWLYNVVIPIR